ncbi:PREDICTED: uncharacterized protein LOC108567921 isoform X2 [Nicrophorus vespilloides]|uniref:Uncharacterized protein LOC108567921 isoform X2 n=1 Tax=Nicrophorus vespilloides TaxID=110193 RepID=A0ABM1NBL0_NICVS|nr:PREDICTED: uncharacterized protein LOC108567921 isoform X2 [Nicrophorus vespilloides]
MSHLYMARVTISPMLRVWKPNLLSWGDGEKQGDQADAVLEDSPPFELLQNHPTGGPLFNSGSFAQLAFIYATISKIWIHDKLYLVVSILEIAPPHPVASFHGNECIRKIAPISIPSDLTQFWRLGNWPKASPHASNFIWRSRIASNNINVFQANAITFSYRNLTNLLT